MNVLWNYYFFFFFTIYVVVVRDSALAIFMRMRKNYPNIQRRIVLISKLKQINSTCNLCLCYVNTTSGSRIWWLISESNIWTLFRTWWELSEIYFTFSILKNLQLENDTDPKVKIHRIIHRKLKIVLQIPSVVTALIP